MRFQFTAPFDYTPSEEPRIQIAYRPDGGAEGDGVYVVKREAGEAAQAAGKGMEIDAPATRDPLDHDSDGRKGGFAQKTTRAVKANAEA